MLLKDHNPNDIATKNSGIFGLPHTVEDAKTIILPVPWDVTTSYSDGTSNAPKAILEASTQLDIYHSNYPKLALEGVAMMPISTEWIKKNTQYREIAKKLYQSLEQGKELNNEQNRKLEKINMICQNLNKWVQNSIAQFKGSKKKIILCGGDHSSSLGYINHCAHNHKDFGVLQIDAHMDLRDSYAGFTYSHASVMFNAMKHPQLTSLTQIGIRDYCEEENNLRLNSKQRLKTFFDRDLKSRQFKGDTWDAICDDIISTLPHKVYLSVDVDGFNPRLCPNTGTPVPGGLEFAEFEYLLVKLNLSDKEIIGADLVEVAPAKNSEWDANVGARLLLAMIVSLNQSHNLG